MNACQSLSGEHPGLSILLWSNVLTNVLTEKKKKAGQGEDENRKKRIFSLLMWHTFAPDTLQIWKYRPQRKLSCVS